MLTCIYDTYPYTAVNEEWGEGDSYGDVSNLPVIKKISLSSSGNCWHS